MDLICSSCAEWKSVGACKSVESMPSEKNAKFLIDSNMTRNIDGKFYICTTCRLSVDQNVEPRRAQKEMLGFLSFPLSLNEVLETQCIHYGEKERDSPKKTYLKINRLEDYLSLNTQANTSKNMLIKINSKYIFSD